MISLVRKDGLESVDMSEDAKAALYTLPMHMHDSVVNWITRAEPRPALMGSFLRAVLSNDLLMALAFADDENAASIIHWGRFLYNHMPPASFGSAEKLDAWYEAHHGSDDVAG